MKLVLLLFALGAAVSANEEANKELVTINDKFTARFFTEVVKAKPDKSNVMSAYSVLTPLAQLTLASAGSSHSELLKALSISDDEQLKKVFGEASNQLRVVKGIELKQASSVYIGVNEEINDDFVNKTRDLFQTEIKTVDFAKGEDAAKEINSWVENNTNKKIKDLVSGRSLTEATRAILVNAIYFKGTWKDSFREEDTKNRKFFKNGKTPVEIPFMHRQGHYTYGESQELDAQILQLDYEGREASLVVILPNDVTGIHCLEEKLQDSSLLRKTLDSLGGRTVDVYLPKFKIETTTDLKEVLTNMGITKLFTPRKANLKNLLKATNNLYISGAVQKAFIEVNEKGTEAAAANEFSSVGISMFVGPPSPKFEANHPFVYMIKYKSTILFNGVYYAD